MAHAPELLMMAAKYQVPLLEAMCEQAIVSNLLNVDNCIPLLQFADTHGSLRMQNSICRFMKLHENDVRRRKEYIVMKRDEKSLIQERMRTVDDESDDSNAMQRFIPHYGTASSTKKTGKFSFCCVM